MCYRLHAGYYSYITKKINVTSVAAFLLLQHEVRAMLSPISFSEVCV
jgi:hypothetical protein